MQSNVMMPTHKGLLHRPSVRRQQPCWIQLQFVIYYLSDRLLEASQTGTSPDKYGDQPAYKSQPSHIAAHIPPPALNTARLAAAQQHSCHSRCHLQSGPSTPTTGCVAPALCPAATLGATTTLSAKAMSSTASPHAGEFQPACCAVLHMQTHMLTALCCACSESTNVCCLLDMVCIAGFCRLPSPTAHSW